MNTEPLSVSPEFETPTKGGPDQPPPPLEISTPETRAVPPVHKLDATHKFAGTTRHIPVADVVEPKVFSPHVKTSGHAPRRIEVERKKRLFASIDVQDSLRENGVMDFLKSEHNPEEGAIVDNMPLHLFDNTDYENRPLSEWQEMVSRAPEGLPARAMLVKEIPPATENQSLAAMATAKADKANPIEWRICKVMRSTVGDLFEVAYCNSKLAQLGVFQEDTNLPRSTLHRIFICFDAEDPLVYCDRLNDCIKRKRVVNAKLALNLYVDCMPVDNLKPLDSEQVNRVLDNAINMQGLRNNPLLDTSSLLQQYNLNHMRTLNQLIFVKLLRHNVSEVQAVKTVSVDPDLFVRSRDVFPERRSTDIPLEAFSLASRLQEFKFNSLWNRLEAIRVVVQIQSENYALERQSFFTVPEKTLRLQEYSNNQLAAGAQLGSFIKDQWFSNVTASVRQHLKDVKKGWFNIEEANLEVYNFSKLRKFLFRINFMMEDTVRNMMVHALGDYYTAVRRFCPTNIVVVSNDRVDLTGGRFPLLKVDLKFADATATCAAKFIYSQTPDSLFEGIMAPFDACFEFVKGLVKLERRVMKQLFWAADPIMRVPHSGEEWVATLRSELDSCVHGALVVMDEYLLTLSQFTDLISIDIDVYAQEAVERFTLNDQINLPELCALARQHAGDADAVFNLLPTAVSLGLVMVDCNVVKTMLSSKHKNIAAKLFEVLERKTREFAEGVSAEFSEMYVDLAVVPADIEELVALREYMVTLPPKIDALSDKIEKNESHYLLMSEAKWRIGLDQMDLKWEIYRWPFKMQAELAKQEKTLRVLEHQYKKTMEDDQGEFAQEMSNLALDVGRLKSYTNLGDAEQNAEVVRRLRQSLVQAEEKSRLFNSREGLYNSAPTEYNELPVLTRQLEPFFDLWDSAEKWLSNKEVWDNGVFVELDAEGVENSVNALQRSLQKSGKTFDRLGFGACSGIVETIKQELADFSPKVPLITALRNAGMRDRHWEELSDKTKVAFPEDKSDLTLSRLVELGCIDYIGEVEKVAEKAGKEFAIETSLDKMESQWSGITLVIDPYKETGTYIFKNIEECMVLLDEHITSTQAMSFSSFKGPFEQRIDRWNSTLLVVSEVIDEWVNLQRNWLYLQPIFESADINKQLPQEGKRFATVDKYWRTSMSSASKGALAIKFCDDHRLNERFKEGNKLLEMVQKGLADYLETKRSGFSRFYFLSNDELLEILSETKDPLRVQPHLRKCFEGIKAVDFQDDLTISGMKSPEGEKVPFVAVVDPKGKNIENWMCDLKDAMVAGVRDHMVKCVLIYKESVRTEWMCAWPAMCVLNGSQVHWTTEVEQYLRESGNKGCFEYYDVLKSQLADMVILIRGKISKLSRMTVGALAVVDVHARDVQLKMANAGVSAVTDFDWISQMRYYWDGELDENKGNLSVIMVSSKRWYGYEYLGNSMRLVITPLTDKCYLTLMGALQMIFGGAPAGPAGTGKTETTKDLAKALAMQCVVFNCSDGLDYLAMGKFFKGLASSGAWACFDEFNRINIEVLSVIAQQIIQLQGTVQRGEKRTVFEGTDILVNPDFSVFITMNPGYAGRAELPDNLEALFRPVAMMVPDYGLIGEIMLFSFGYMENRKCAQKMVATFRLCSEQLSAQDHYDYGMRAVKTVITAAGNLKAASPDANEEALLMRALQDVNVPKFLAQDLPLYAGILSDLFPGIERPPFDYGPLITCLKESIDKRGLQPIEMFITKNIELYEMICVRHGLMVVGPTGGGKSSNIRVLGDALALLKKKEIEGERYEKTKIVHLNPKSITMGQLYGDFDENTHEWRDGILCVLIRQCIKQDDSVLKWMLFDGPVDALWIENMNTVLDDNKKLCLTSGEIIQLSEPMTMMFEPEDLAVASPATVSRCGMIYMEPTSLGYDVLIQSWFQRLPKSLMSIVPTLQGMFDTLFPSILPVLRRSLEEPLPTTNNSLVAAILNLMDTFIQPYHPNDDAALDKQPEDIVKFIDQIRQVCVFCIIWGMCATVNAPSRKKLEAFIRNEFYAQGMAALLPPQEDPMYGYKYDLEESQWIPWVKSTSPYVYDPKASFAELIIPTQDSICYTYVLDILLRNKKHVLMSGPTGTGKTVNIQGHLQNGLPEKYVPITIGFSAQTGANQTQDLIDSKCEKRRKGVYGPPVGKEFVIFVDDVNMPQKEVYGAQPPIEILRQWFDDKGWYDRKALEIRKIVDVVFVCACGPPGGGRNSVTARFYRHFNTITYVDMSDASLALIFSTILRNFLGPFDEDVQRHTTGLVDATIRIYNTLLEELRPTPTKPHYVFNMRDCSKVFQGMLMIDKRKVTTGVGLGRVWVHELTRVFGDRLISEADREWLASTIQQNMEANTELTNDDLYAKRADVIMADFMVPGSDVRVYEECDGIGEVQTVIEEQLNEYNALSKQPMQLVMFKDALQHVCKITRVLRQPSGNALLLGVGGSGRQSLTKLASYIMTYKLFQIEIAKGYGMAEWRENLKECLLYTGVTNKPLVFLFNDVQIINEMMLEDINGVLNSGDVPNIYAAEDLEAIAGACKIDCQKKKIPPTKLNLFAMFLARVKSNIHVVLCMSPLGDAFRARLRKFPSIVNCCTIDWFMEWPDEALQSVASRFMASANLKIAEEDEKKLMVFFQYIHQSIEKASVDFKNQAKRFYYVTPTSYLQLLTTYSRVLVLKRKEVGTLRDRLAVGVDKLIATEKAVNELQAQLTAMEPELIKTQGEVEVMIVVITKDKAVAAEVKAVVEVEEAAASKKAADTKAIADDAQRDLDEALPALEEAVQCLKDLKKSDIDEVKSLGKPPKNVIKTLTACCIMFDIKPDKINDPDNPGKKVNDYFKPAGKHLLSNANKLLDDMQNYDKDNIPANIISQMEPFYNDPEFTPEIIEKASKACKAMCMWARAMYKYHQVCLMVEPKKKLLAEAQVSLDATMKILAEAQATLHDAESKINSLEAAFKEANDKKEQLVVDVEQCRARLERAVKLMSGLGGERTRWTSSCASLSASYDCLVGDCLVSAGSIGYMGVFTPDFRHRITEQWQAKLKELGLPHSEGCGLRMTMADPVAIRAWTIFGLPQDSHSVENGIIMSSGKRYPLLIDPQGQANRYIKNMGKDVSVCPNDLDVVKLTEKNFLRTLESAVRYGKWVLLENVGETLDAALEPLLLQQKFKQGGTEMIKIGDSTIPWNDQFKFFITTKLPNPHYPPEVCVKVSLLNFAITFTGLADQLLGVVVVEEMPEMEEKKNSLMVSNARMRKELQDLEDQILFMLSNSTGNILDDHKLIETLGSSKIKSQEITAKVTEAEKTEVLIDENRNKYRPVAFRGAILYFCTTDLGNVDPMYQYSLQWFRNLFVQAIRLSEPSADIETRLEILNAFFTYYVYTNICRSLFERHKLLFSFLLTVRILQGDSKIDNEEYMFLLSGKAAGVLSTAENPAPGWIDGRMWSEMTALSSLSAFDGLSDDISERQLFWREIYDAGEPHRTALPFHWAEKLNSFQKLCFLRTIRADVVATAVMDYVVEQMGHKFVEPPPFDLLACFKDSSILTPLVFVLSKGSDPTKELLGFAAKMKMDKKIKMLSLGQGQGPKAIKMVEEGTQKGGWVFLQNCHLFISWLPELERICENFSPDTVHKDFRLWLTSMPCADFPVAVLQSAVKMTNEPPKGLKANLRNAYYKLNNDLLNVTHKPEVYKKLLFGLSFFHAVVQERRIFGPLGWNIPYEFNDTDLDISKGQLEIFLDQYDETPWEVLNTLTSYINYGGRVTDYIDLRTIDVIMKSFYNPGLLRPNYKFDQEGVFYSLEADEADSHTSYVQYIESLPLTAAPGVFGMHDNARIASANAETFLLCDILLSLQASDSGGGGGGDSREKQIEVVAQAIVEKKITTFDTESVSMMYPVVYEQSMNTVLLQECIRYNHLLELMNSTLPTLILALKGLVVMSQELESISNSLFLNTVPGVWTAAAYPSMKNLLAWVEDLVERLVFVQKWIDKGVPEIFWISGFYFPQAFLTGSLQNYARKYKIAIDTVSYDFKFLEEDLHDITVGPENGVFIRGLFLEGARWDPTIKSLNDSLPKKLYTEVPVIHLQPKQNRPETSGGVYRCPVYKILSRRGTLSTTGHSTNFVMWIEVPSNRPSFLNNEGKSDQEVWVKAGVACFTSLMY